MGNVVKRILRYVGTALIFRFIRKLFNKGTNKG
ncbi:Uncharacterised protein [Mammaliicoccus fleurettii]|nr:Uncharacterised protein [Mammaliicoccus fleurettii]